MTLRHQPLRLRAALAGMALVLMSLAAWAIATAQPTGAAAPTGAPPAPAASGPKVLPTITTEPLPSGAVVTQVLPNMNLPTAMVFDPTGRLFYTEKTTGNVRLFENGVLQTNPVITFAVSATGERGLLGITLHPDFSNNHLVYVYYTSNELGLCTSGVENRVAHFVETNGVGSNPQIIFRSCQTAGNHVGGNIHFGPDGMLYITIGENAQPANSQNPYDKRGKIHRVTPEGQLPTVIPNPEITSTQQISSVFALGLRNSFDFDFDPLTPMNPWPRLFASENGPGCDDEMNRIEGGYNYGWRPSYPCDDEFGPDPAWNTIPPIWFLGDIPCCEAPTGTHFYRGTAVPQWTNELFMCAYTGGRLRHFYLDPTRTYAITVATVTGVTCNMDIETGPDGAFYYIQGGGYTPGTLYKITVPGAVTATPTTIQPTATNTPTSPPATPTNTAVPPTVTGTPPPATPTGTAPPSTPTATPTGTHVMPSPTATEPGGATSTPTTPPTATATNTPVNFQDVPPSNTFYPFVSCLARIGIVQGYPCGGTGEPCGTSGDPYFRPNAYVTRGQIAKIVAESAYFDQQIPPDRRTFEDVPYGSTFWEYVERLAETNLIGGYQCGVDPNEPCIPPDNRPYFRPNAGATRGQLTKIVSNAAGFNDEIPTTQQTFTDVEPGHTFWIYVERLLENRPGVMGGYVCGGPGEPCDAENRAYFRPNNPLTRGQTSKIVANTFFPDCIVPVVVKIQDFAYWPEDVTVSAGTTVRFINRDLDYHTATEDGNIWDTGRLDQHQFADVVMSTVADYGYYCIPHPYMRGAIHVR